MKVPHRHAAIARHGRALGLALALVSCLTVAPVRAPLAQAADGSGTAVVTPTSVSAGSVGNTLTFVYTAAEAMDSGSVRINVPSGWSAPHGVNGAAGYVTASSAGGIIADVEDAMDSAASWVAEAGDCNLGMSADAAVFHEGTASISCRNSSATNNTLLYRNLAAAQNWSGYTNVAFWIRTSVNLNSGHLKFLYDDNANLATPIASINLPAVTANTWTYVNLPLTGVRTSVASLGFQTAGATAVTNNFNIDDILLGPGLPSFPGGGDIRVRALQLAASQTVTVVYGAGGGASGAAAPASGQTSVFNVTSRISDSGTLTSIVSSPIVTVFNPAPTTTGIVPTTATAGGAAFTMTVNGTNFVPASVVRFNGSDRATTYVSATQLTASVLAADIAAPGSNAVTVFNPTPGGGASNAQTLAVTSDVTAPSAVANLALSSPTTSSMTLTWTAPGDDGAVGTASLYDIRYATSPIVTAGDFTAAALVSGEPAPAAAGISQSMTVTGLSANTSYYFAMKTQDEVSNVSGVSNVPVLSTLAAADTTAPAVVTNLALSSPTTSSIVLTWTAPGDDLHVGTAAVYDIRYSTSPIVTLADFTAAALVSGEPAPAAAGTSQTMTVTGLSANQIHYFAMKTWDEVPNVSAVSNVPSLSTAAAADTSSPAAITNLTASSPTTSSIVLTWTAPGDDGVVGTAAVYDIRYSTTPIVTLADFTAAALVTGEPVPAVAGTSQTMTVFGLSANQIHHFAMKTQDEVPNVSAVSNTPSLSTAAAADVTSPAAITNLTPSSPTTSSVLLTWTAPGDDANSGTAAVYDIRYSTSPIVTLADFTAAALVSGEPAPAAAGTSQTMTVTGLSANQIHYFAMKTWDEVPNVSAVSNVPSLATAATVDTTPPSGISDLSLSAASASSMVLAWTAPGDDANSGTASLYDIRYATSPIATPADFTAATAVSGEPLPSVAGSSQTMSVAGLSVNTTYFFAMTTRDEAPNISALSNVPSLTTTGSSGGGGGGGTPDTNRPAAVTNLSLSNPTTGTMTLSWTAPGDDGNNGTAFRYDIRYSTSPILTDADFTLASLVSAAPAPAAAGTLQTMTVTGLATGRTYYFALKTQDEVPNLSGISNLPSLATATSGGGGGGGADTTAPVNYNISVASITKSSAIVTWETLEAADSLVRYGTGTTLDLQVSESVLTFKHSVPILGLIAGTAYRYETCSSDGAGNQGCSIAFIFTPLPATAPDPTYGAAEALAASPIINVDKGLVAPPFGTPVPCVSGALIKLPDDGNAATQSDSAVYYCGADGKRYVFPDLGTYRSWYPDFSGVTVVSASAMADVPLGGNVTYRPGKFMIKIQTDPKTYAIAKDGTLRWVTSESVALSLYGLLWNDLVYDISDAFFADYRLGEPIYAADVPPPVIVTEVPPPPSGMCTTPTAFTAYLAPGSDDPQVRPLQALLGCLGHLAPDVPQTGHFGPATEEAVKSFQTANGIEPAGYVGPATRAALNRYVAP